MTNLDFGAAPSGRLTLAVQPILLPKMAFKDLAPRIFASLLCASCASAPSVTLRAPVSDHCLQAELDGCEQIADGVLLYVDGRRAEALPKLSAGAAENSPERLTKFSDLLGTLEQRPGSEKYSASIQGVVATLRLEASQKAKRNSQQKGHFDSGGKREDDTLSRVPLRAVSADTDPKQLRGGLEVSPTETLGWCTHVFGEGSHCATIAQGPLYLTDAVPNGRECHGQFLAVVSGDALAARFDSPLSIHGGRIFVPSGSSLVFGQLSEPSPERGEARGKSTQTAVSAESKGSLSSQTSAPAVSTVDKVSTVRVVLNDASPEWSCLLYWSGFVPYSSRGR